KNDFRMKFWGINLKIYLLKFSYIRQQKLPRILSHIKEDIDILCDYKYKVDDGKIYDAGSEIRDE
ncbi:MAG: hypothetical protein PWQ94_934, partial [Thermoanaerobacterium sp.]|nr:hypothetical protein [Thermoanaerobacterium sp.]